MKASYAIFALLTPLWYVTAGEEWLATSAQEWKAAQTEIDTIVQSLSQELLLQGYDRSEHKKLDTSMPHREGPDTVGVSDGGLLFDTNNSRFIYVDNVRINSPKIKLWCRDFLYLHFPNSTMDSEKKRTQMGSKGHESTQNTNRTPGEEQTPTYGEPLGSDIQNKSPQITDPEIDEPIEIYASGALADTTKNQLYFLGDPTLKFQKGDYRAELLGNPQAAAKILSHTNGDITLTADELHLTWKDAQGVPCKLDHKGGPVYYHAATQTLLFLGSTFMQTGEGTLSSQEKLTISIRAENSKKSNEFMGQFLGLTIEGVRAAEATGQIVATRPAYTDHPASTVSGDKLTYNGDTGECLLTGKETILVYGQNTLKTDGEIHLAANGDLSIRGEQITGTYTRPDRGTDRSIEGDIQTKDSIQYIASENRILFPKGIITKDPCCYFQCTGQLDLYLQKNAQTAVPPREKTGMINLSIATCNDLSRIRGTGDVLLDYTESEDGDSAHLVADEVDFDVQTGEALLTSTSGKETVAQYKEYRLSSMSSKATSSLHLEANGNLDMKGDVVTASLPIDGGMATAQCNAQLYLYRETGKLEMSEGARIETPSAIMTSYSTLGLTLEKDSENTGERVISRYPQLVYNFKGLKQAHTAKGGTLQTTQASMQCTGPIKIDMAQDQGRTTKKESNISYAQAEGNVAIAGRDSSGRLITAKGDKVTLNGQTGEKRLTGSTVILQDRHNIHIASGRGAAVTLDRENNASISGAKQSSSATHIHEQIENKNTKNMEKL